MDIPEEANRILGRIKIIEKFKKWGFNSVAIGTIKPAVDGLLREQRNLTTSLLIPIITKQAQEDERKRIIEKLYGYRKHCLRHEGDILTSVIQALKAPGQEGG